MAGPARARGEPAGFHHETVPEASGGPVQAFDRSSAAAARIRRIPAFSLEKAPLRIGLKPTPAGRSGKR